MAINDMNQLLKHELGDLLYAERTFLKGLKKMSKEISDPRDEGACLAARH